MHTTSSLLRCSSLLCLGAALVLPASRTFAAGAPADADAFPTYDSYIKISGESPFITGDAAAFAARTDLPSYGTYGIEDFLLTKDLPDNASLKVSGHAMDGSDDYLGVLDLSKDDLGSLEVGYKRYRIFYDGVGGFFPLTDTFERMANEDLHVDRSAFWFQTKIAKSDDGPSFTLSYHDEIRTGMKDSSEWATIINPDATITKGALVGTADPTNTPYIAPNVETLNEHHNIVEGTFRDTVGDTTETFKATLDWVNNDDVRNYVKYPHSTVIADPQVNVVDDEETVQSRTFRLINQTESTINKYITLETGLSYFHLTGEDGGNWITPSYNTGAKAIFNTVTAGNIFATPEVDDFVGNVFLKFTPTKDWRADVGFRDEYNVIQDSGGFTTESLASTAKSTASTYVTTAQDQTYSHEVDHVDTPEINIDYLGIKNLTIYAEFDDRTNKGNQHWVNPFAATSTSGTGVVTTVPIPITSVFYQDANQDNQDAKLGANWNPTQQLTFRAELFRKDHQNRFIGSNDYVGTASYGTLFATGYTFTGVTLSAIYRPIPELSFNTRYQNQDGQMAVTAATVNGGLGTESPSGKATIQMISETIDWSPYKQLYFQANANVVYNTIQTAYPAVTINAANTIAVPFVNSDNNYTTSSAICGFAANKTTDVQLQGFWERADNYNPQVELGGIPYGAGFQLESLTVGVKHKFSKSLMGELKVGYMKSFDQTTGGFTNYDGPLAYVALTYAL
jgi:hypothetical protein